MRAPERKGSKKRARKSKARTPKPPVIYGMMMFSRCCPVRRVDDGAFADATINR